MSLDPFEQQKHRRVIAFTFIVLMFLFMAFAFYQKGHAQEKYGISMIGKEKITCKIEVDGHIKGGRDWNPPFYFVVGISGVSFERYTVSEKKTCIDGDISITDTTRYDTRACGEKDCDILHLTKRRESLSQWFQNRGFYMFTDTIAVSRPWNYLK